MADYSIGCANNERLNALVAQVSEEIGRNELAHESYERRLLELKRDSEKQTEILVTMQKQADAIENVSDKVDQMAVSVKNISTRISEIEREPGDKWKKIAMKLLEYSVLLIAGIAAGIVFNGYI